MEAPNPPEPSPATVNAEPTARPTVTCREIRETDLDAVAACLQRHFPERTFAYWRNGLERLARRSPVPGWPRFGHLVAVGDDVVGALVQICAPRGDDEQSWVRCNLSSWCLDEAYRAYAILLHRRAVAFGGGVYVNISASPHTHKSIEAVGFRRYSGGQTFFSPLLSRGTRGAMVLRYRPESPLAADLPAFERRLLADNAGANGCQALIGILDGEATPFVLQWRTVFRNVVPGGHVVYARSEADLLAFSRALGAWCALRGRFFLVADGEGPIAGLRGKYFAEREPRYYSGPRKPSPLDLIDTELQIFGR